MKQIEKCKQNGIAKPHPTLLGIYTCGSRNTCDFKLNEVRRDGLPVCLANVKPLAERMK